MMKKSLLVVLALFSGCVLHAQKEYTFNEGPVRMQCKADSLFATVGKPWPWSCTIAGDISPYIDTPIGIQIKMKSREEFPQREIVGEGLKRVYPYTSTFETEYYLDLTGNSKINDPFATLIRPDDPSAPPEPIEGIEASLDGSFWLEVLIVEVTSYDPATKEVKVKDIAKGRVHGKLICPQCVV